MRKIILLIISAAIMVLAGWGFANDNYPAGIIVMVIWFFMFGFYSKDSGYGFLYGTELGVIVGAFITSYVFTNFVFNKDGEVQTIAYVSNHSYNNVTTPSNGKTLYENNVTYFAASIAYPTYGITGGNFIYRNYQERVSGRFDNYSHPLSDTVIISFSVSRPENYKILNAHPSSAELAKYSQPKVRVSGDILDGGAAMDYIRKYSGFYFDPDMSPWE